MGATTTLFAPTPYMGIHDVTTPYLGMLTLPLPYMGIGSRDMVWRDHDGGREVPGGSKRGQKGPKGVKN